jgi:hypothetical protein
MPVYTTGTPVRTVSGATETSDISSSDLNDLIDIAERFMIKDISVPVHGEKLIGNIDGSNSKFETRNEPIGDRTLIGDSTGSPVDVIVHSLEENSDEPDDYTELTVTSVNRRWGEIELQSAPASEIDAILGDYVYYPQPMNLTDLQNAATYLAAHLVTLLQEAPDKVTLADIERNTLVIKINPTRFLDMYESLIRRAGKSSFMAVTL